MSRDDPIADDLARPDVNVRLILAVGAAVLLMLAVVVGATLWFYRWNVPNTIVMVPKEFPQPQLMQDENDTLRRVQETARERLNGWRWVDRKAGVISIPVDIAMQKLLTRPDPYAPLIAAPETPAGGAL